MSTWARQIAWLNTAPETKDIKKEPVSRLERKRHQGETIDLPPNPAKYLTDWLFDIGPTVGGEVLTYRDLAAWQQISGVELLPWEGRLLRRLSGDFASQQHKARNADCPPPYIPLEDEGAVQDRVSAQFADMMRSLKGKGSRGKQGA